MRDTLTNIEIPGNKTYPIIIKRQPQKDESIIDIEVQLKLDLSEDS